MYVAHFYAGTHKENIRNKISTALNAGVQCLSVNVVYVTHQATAE